MKDKHGARTFPLDGGTILVKQTTLREDSNERVYRIESDAEGKHIEFHCAEGPNQIVEIGEAVIMAHRGCLDSYARGYTVTLTETGSHYHRTECSKVKITGTRENDYQIPYAKAQQEGKLPCPECDPDPKSDANSLVERRSARANEPAVA